MMDQDFFDEENLDCHSDGEPTGNEEERVAGDGSLSQTSDARVSSAGFKLSSDVYNFIEDRGGHFYCKCCKVNWSVRSTTNFRKHLSKFHSDRYSSRVEINQSKLPHHGFKADKGTKWKQILTEDFSGADKAHADEKLTDWIINHAQPFSVVEHASFIEFCSALRNNYSLPVRNTVRARILKRWESQKNLVREKLTELAGHRCGITTDMWTSPAKRGYMSVTLHYINSAWEMKAVLLAFVRVMYPHTGKRLAKHLIEAVVTMDGSLLKSMWAITTDNASSNQSMLEAINSLLQAEINEFATAQAQASSGGEFAFTDLQTHHQARHVFQLRCFAHVLQLAVKEGLKQCYILDVSIGKSRDLIKRITDSPKLLEGLQGICAALKITHKTPELDCETRWNSTWSMMKSFLSLRKPVEELLRRIRERHYGYTDFSISPTDSLAVEIPRDSWCVMEDFCRFLGPFKEATELMSASEYPTLGMVIPVYHLISEHVQNAIGKHDEFSSSNTLKFAEAMKTKLAEYQGLICKDQLQVAAALDPRVKPYLQRVGIDLFRVKHLIIIDFEEEYQDRYEAEQAEARRTDTVNEDSQTGQQGTGSLFQLLSDNAISMAGTSQEPFESELERWMNHAPMKLTQSSRDVCMWFKVNTSMYPRVQMMARDYLGVTATSVPSECAFSRAGTIVSNRRARLGDEAVQAISELQSFLSFLKVS